VRSTCDRGSAAKFLMVSHRMGDQNLLSRAPPCFGTHVKPLVPVAFADVSTASAKVDLVERGRLEGISEMPLLPLWR
jgi:hypothetical protein